MKVLLFAIIFLCLCGCAPVQPVETPQAEPLIPSEGEWVVTVEHSPPQPINKILMLSPMGHWWGRIPPKENWGLKMVWCDAKNFLPYPVHLDSAIVEIASQTEEVPIDITLDFKEYNGEIFIYPQTIRDIESGEYPLCVSLKSNGQIMCEREDLVVISWGKT